jgi:hypothetical protein
MFKHCKIIYPAYQQLKQNRNNSIQNQTYEHGIIKSAALSLNYMQ